MRRKLTRREATRALGAAGGSLVLAPAMATVGTRTPGQTEGPFYPVEPQDDRDEDLTLIEGRSEPALGDTILVRGRVLNTAGEVLPGATVDVWQANHHGRYSHPKDPNPNPLDPNFQGWGVMQTGARGGYGFKTIMPGPYAISDNTTRSRHIHFKVSHPGHESLTTQMYFEGDPLIEGDVVMNATPEKLRSLLIAKASPDPETGLPIYRFDIVLG